MKTLSKSLLAGAAALALSATPATAQQWYNGQWNGVTVRPSERTTQVPDSRIYDNFQVMGLGWNVTALFGDFFSNLAPAQAFWEIRSGVSAGNGGTLLYSGVNDISWLLLGAGAGGYDQYRATVGQLGFTLTAGTYWMTIAPIGYGSGRAFVDGTAGVGGVNPLLDGNSYWDSPYFSQNFAPNAPGANFAYGINGSDVVAPTLQLDEKPDLPPDENLDLVPVVAPEPGSLVLLATGLGVIGLGVHRRRRSPPV